MNTTNSVVPAVAAPACRTVAPAWHTIGLLLLLALITYAGVRTHGTSTKNDSATNLIPLYLTVMGGEWALVFYVWRGIRRGGTTLRDLIGTRFPTVRSLANTAFIAIVFWFIWEGCARAMHLLLGPSNTANVAAILPRTSIEIGLWCLVSCTAGFCEEVLYRGYLQRQFKAWTGSAPAAVAIQAVIFGMSHGYQGTKQMVIISVLGALYGILAEWRRSLVPGIAAHAWSDIYGGWLHP